MTTRTGLRVAEAIYPILLEQAHHGATITYGALAAEMKTRSPNDDVIANVIPRSLGKRLLLLRRFTNEQGYPDLSSLVINAHTEEVGEAYSDEFDPEEQRRLVRAFDWAEALPEFSLFIEERVQELATRNRPRRNREEVKEVLWQFAKENPKGPLPSPQQREAVIQMLMDGENIEDAIAEIVGN